ncbi:MAG: WYL domain-containing protein [Kiritimatiellaeota bacterium]|nr:WYL domain-containing protein [Kiritimatiellota bacterium]
MPVNKKQLKRMIKFVAMLKENRYPNCNSFVEELRREDIDGNVNISCTRKTIQRDIKTLRDEFDAPIEYDYDMKGYYLHHHGWDFPCPLFEEREMLASVIGARIAEDILPEPMRSEVRQAVDFQLTTNNPDFLDTAYMSSLVVSSGLKVNISPEVFNVLFDAWKERRTARIVYRDFSDKRSEREIEPHALVFMNSAWFVKAFCLSRSAPRAFAMHRVLEAELGDGRFDPDLGMVDSVGDGHLFVYEQFENIETRCDANILNFIKEKPVHKDQAITMNEDGSFTLRIPSMARHEAVQFVMYQLGDAEAIAPEEFRREVVLKTELITKKHKTRRRPGC